MGDDKFRLPSSYLDELETIIAGYAQQENDVNNDDVAKVTSVSKQMVGRNNKFLTEVGIIDGGNKKNFSPEVKI